MRIGNEKKGRQLISKSVNLQDEVTRIRNHLWSKYGPNNIPPFDPKSMKENCDEAGAKKLFPALLSAMSSDDQSQNRELQNEKKCVTIINMLMFGQSQKASWFQKILSNQVVSRGISDSGLSILNKSGISASKSTQKRELQKLASSHSNTVKGFIDETIRMKCLLVLMIDDYTNIHTKHRPLDSTTSTARSMATILLKRFPDVPAITADPSLAVANPQCLSIDLISDFFERSCKKLFLTFASVMPQWIRTIFFDPEMERHRYGQHNYQQQQSMKALRKMKECRLVDEVEMPLKCFDDFFKASCHAAEQGLDKYLEHFICPQPGDWPAQFYMRQIQYNATGTVPQHLQNIVPFIGPLHVQLNARQSLCVTNIQFFKAAYSWIFGSRKRLATKPRADKITVLEEILYGGWTVVRDHVMAAFCQCKDLQFLTLVNMLDNFLPAVLSVYSVVFKTGNTELYADTLLRLWAMFFCYKRHHYNKAPLIWISNFLFWQKQEHPLFSTLMKTLNAFDEYPVENFHSILRSQTSEADSGEVLRKKAKALDFSKVMTSNFSSVFATERKYNYKRNKLEYLKLKAAKFIFNLLSKIKENLNIAEQVPRPKGKQRNLTYWKLPYLFGDDIISSKVLPIGFQFAGKEPDPKR